jgi:transcriptional regulator with XRE-family HTH domain
MIQESTPAPASTSVGPVLRRARDRRGESLLQVAERTRISFAYIEALEGDAPISVFPGPMYARFFLREYARYLGLDEGPLLEAFTARPGANEPPALRNMPADAVRAQPKAALPPVSDSDRAARLRASLPAGVIPSGSGLGLGRSGSSLRFARSRGATFAVAGRTPALIGGSLAVAMAVFLGFLAASHLRGPVRPASASGPAKPTLGPIRPLPRGGTEIFPTFRVVAFYGAAGTERLGILGIGPDAAAKRLTKQAAAYRIGHKPVLPAFELIATVALGSPGPDGLYRTRTNAATVQGYLDAARKMKGLLILDIQPGRGDFMTEIKAYEPFLREPDVGLALDPEWHVGPKDVPGKTIGSVDAATVNDVVSYLTGLIERYRLPQKLLVIHRFTVDMVQNKGRIKTPPQVAVVMDVDGYGGKQAKIVKYHSFVADGERFYHGIKLYYRQDTSLLSPEDIAVFLQPDPNVIIYQ